MLAALHLVLPLAQDLQDLSSTGGLLGRGKADVEDYLFTKLVLDLALDPGLEVSDGEAVGKSVDLVDDQEDAAPLFVDEGPNLINLTAFEVCNV